MTNVSHSNRIYFKDRDDAASQLAEALQTDLFLPSETVVIGISEGGAVIADRLATFLRTQADILLTEPILAPNNPEVPVAMVSETEEVVIHKALTDAFEISDDYIYGEAHRKHDEEVLGYVYRYRKGSEMLPVKGKTVIVADECVESGLTMMAALKSVIAREAKNVYIATPIIDKSVYENLLSVCDGVFCPHKIEDYISVEYYYESFDPVDFETIEAILRRHRTEIMNESQANTTKENDA